VIRVAIRASRLERPGWQERLIARLRALPGVNIAETYELPHDPRDIRLALANIVSTARGLNVSEIHLAMDWARWSDTKQLLTELRVLPIPVRLIADGRVREILQYPKRQLGGVVSVELQRAPLTACERAAKRAATRPAKRRIWSKSPREAAGQRRTTPRIRRSLPRPRRNHRRAQSAGNAESGAGAVKWQSTLL